jgi:minimal PKS acyl carrier protein
MSQFSIDDLKRIMRECAGEDETVNLAGDISAAPFDELGYDSLALMETASRVSREYGVSLPDELLEDIQTPAAFVACVNDRLAEPTGVR